MIRWWSSLGAAGVVAGSALVGLGAPGIATACACGGVLSHDVTTRVADEVALVTTDGTTETVVMRLNLESTTDNAALVVPTPTPAKVDSASETLFDELQELSAPRVETVRDWTFGSVLPGASPPEGVAATAGVPAVLDQVHLGPLEATTVSGGSLTGVQDWLTAHGYVLRQEISAGLDPYLREGWSVVAMRLTSTAPLNGPLAPVKLTFASDRLVYPMRMSAQARSPQNVVIYTLGEHRMARGDADAATQPVETDYAGTIADRADDPTLSELPGDYLTRMSTWIGDPAAITSDFEFVAAPNDEPFQRVVYRHETYDITIPVLAGAAAAVFLAVLAAAVVVVRRRSA